MNRTKWAKVALLLIVFLSASAVYAEAPFRLEFSRTLTGAIRDADGVRPGPGTDPATLLYTAALGTPLLAPDGHQLTWGEWDLISSTNASFASVKCVEKGTHVVLKYKGLIPNALYTMWLFVQVLETSPVDAGRLPSLVSDSNAFTTDESGSAVVNAIVPAGPLSISGEITDCLFDFENFSLNLAYHSDGRLYGDVPGPDGVTVQQFAFGF